MRFLLPCLVALIHGVAFSQGDGRPTVYGPVTRLTSSTDFAVSEAKVTLGPETQFRLMWPDGSSVVAKQPVTLFIGEHVEVFQAPRSEIAKRVDIYQPSLHGVDGTATVESVAPGAEMDVQADGYRIRIDADTKVKYDKPLAGASDVMPGMVLKYKGAMEKDGSVLASSATFYEDDVSPQRLKAREDWEFDPATTTAEDHQSFMSRAIRGTDASSFPLHNDAALQQRVSAIGEKLVPAFQKALPADSKLRVHFRFYVVDARKHAEAYYALPSGIVLVSYSVVQKLGDDAQIAAILADAVACLIEAQPMALPMNNVELAAKGAEIAAIGFGGMTLAGLPEARQAHKDDEQRARVSLSLMRDAGFDETVAPKAWWTVVRDETLPAGVDDPSDAALYLYARVAEHEAAAEGMLVGKKR